MVIHRLLEIDEVKSMISEGKVLALTGHFDVLNKLPKGNWVGATSPYFYIKGQNAFIDNQRVFVTDFTPHAKDFKISNYTYETISTVAERGFDNGFTFLALPPHSEITSSFSLNSMHYPKIFDNPVFGLVAGSLMEEFQTATNISVYNGQTGDIHIDKGVALHVGIEDHQVARLEIINVFEPNLDVVIDIDEDATVIKDCLINGEKRNLYDYMKENELLSYLTPFMSNLGGAMINFSPLLFDEENRQVIFAVPLIGKEKVYFGRPLNNYPEAFGKAIRAIPESREDLIFSCNCVSNYLFGDMENNDLGVSGMVAFGEIGYRLLNQTFTYVVIDE